MKKFISFEGIDGCGKSTILQLVYKKLKSNGYDVISTFEPTNSWIGKFVQKCIETEEDPFLTAFTFIADRIEHCKKIRKWLDEGKIVLCDRYAESTYAYQGVQLDSLLKNSIRLSLAATFWITCLSLIITVSVASEDLRSMRIP